MLKHLSSSRKAFSGAVALLLLVGASSANAALTTGWATAVTNVQSLAQLLVTALVALCALAGVGAFAVAGKNLYKKAGDRGDDVEWSKIGYAILAGVFLMAIAYVALNSVQTLGGQQSDIGKTVTIPSN